MWREWIRNHLFPNAERDPGFRREIERLNRNGLLIIGGAQICVSAFMVLARFLLTPESATLPLRFRQAASIVALGLLNIVASRVGWLSRWARLLALVSAFATAAVLTWSSMVIMSQSTNPNDFIPGQITLVMLLAVTIIPLWPSQTLVLGLAIGIDYFISATIAEKSLLAGLGPDDNYLLFITMLTLLCTGITAVLYAQRWSNYQILQQTVEASDALREVQTRVVMTESATSLSRLAAAVSHEMNNPLGALVSGVDTLVLLAAKQATCQPSEQSRLVTMQLEVRRTVQESARRLRELMARMQRFTNLDQADIQSTDLNELLKDVAALVDPSLKQHRKVELQLQPIPPVVCRPQQLSIVFSSLVNNAMHAVNGDGRIVISTRQQNSQVEVEIEDNGRGVNSDELQHIFDPDFRAAGGRMAAVNWSMFNSRQIIREHGGDIQITSSQGQGTRVRVMLPVADQMKAVT